MWCLRATANILVGPRNMEDAYDSDLKTDILIVDNTNTETWECAKYMELALACGWPAFVVNVKCNAIDALARNTHNVPDAVFWHMFNNIENETLKMWWPTIDIQSE